MKRTIDLDMPILRLSPKDVFTLRDAFAGVHVFGGIGSGKTSGSGKTLAGAYLRAGMGGVVLCAKPEEVKTWLGYAEKNGRRDSVVIFDENQGFNFIEYELARHGLDGSSNVVECLMRILDAADHASGGAGGKTPDRFWEDAPRQILNYTIPLLYIAWGTVTVNSIIDFVMSSATSPVQWKDDGWLANSFAAETIKKATSEPTIEVDEGMLGSIIGYWATQYTRIPERTLGNILISLSTRLDRFRRGRLQKAFCGKTTLVPEMTFHGAIIIMAMPALTWNEDGIIGQHLFKFMWQRAVESRNGLESAHNERPVFLWADEAQYFVNLKDDGFLSTCRGSRACVVFMTQTLPSYYAKLGKDQSDAADGLIGKFNTQIFHLNACNRTNTFASQMIGRGLQQRRNSSQSVGTNRGRGINIGENQGYSSSHGSSSSSNGQGGSSYGSNSSSGSSSGTSWGSNISRGSNDGESWGMNEQMDYLVEPNFFAQGLKSGGPKHRGIVTSVWFKAGGTFQANAGSNFLLSAFRQ